MHIHMVCRGGQKRYFFLSSFANEMNKIKIDWLGDDASDFFTTTCSLLSLREPVYVVERSFSYICIGSRQQIGEAKSRKIKRDVSSRARDKRLGRRVCFQREISASIEFVFNWTLCIWPMRCVWFAASANLNDEAQRFHRIFISMVFWPLFDKITTMMRLNFSFSLFFCHVLQHYLIQFYFIYTIHIVGRAAIAEWCRRWQFAFVGYFFHFIYL